ncbi:hypothetical protein NIES4071_29320 [Calothrix sp. NIES-4071]|nr:hypothetical protein NIES4071_29320 [Calothrix sp. NIES-4071]BAZ57252.1 hypothetical protein NIES4105_29260 [Calothrix sp. NIES-4105]
MQNTRLNNLVSAITVRSRQWLSNPWRRTSVIIISFLLGIFIGTAISTSAGQRAELDIYVAALIVLAVELVSRLFYRRPRDVDTFWIEVLNIFKIGLTYSLFIEAFKLGS